MSDRRSSAGGVAMLLLAAVLATTGCGGGATVGGGSDPDASPEERVTVNPSTATTIECGQPFRPPVDVALTMTVQFPTAVSAGVDSVGGTVEVTSREAVRGVGTPRAGGFLVRDGRVVTVPPAQDAAGVRWELAPGEPLRLPGDVSLVSCAAGGNTVGPGTYELYSRVVFTPDGGSTVESFGGPWPIEVR
ncbi:hypothetical protein SAMN05444365_104487 [Micromonospora pattaloongensis]|uniref:Lipoprotein n=1 Tax=Micromonospora pattaloongensis TaxID=405436 RepID=A0A1H3PEY7_9ACTN|nr:hypothetical protein [Micromonospora pattaloongensis]SDY99627.1 hypothetical protein SAMN05444365_104487 [Micromonospora pattaloongensis]